MSEPAAEYRVPGRPGLQQSQVDHACDALLREGKRPTIEAVRQRIGGSPNTLVRQVDDWWQRLGARLERGSPAFERLPGTLALQAEAFFLAALDEARALAQSEQSDRRDAAEKLEEQLSVRSHVQTQREKEFAEKLEQRERSTEVLEQELREKRSLIEKTLATKDSLQRQVDELRIVVATLQAKHAAALATPRVKVRRRPTPVSRVKRVIVRTRKTKKQSKGRVRRGRR